MPLNLTAAIKAVGLCLIVVGAVYAAERTPRANAVVTYSLLRSGSTVRTFATEQACVDARDNPDTGLIAVDARTRTSGTARYVCRKDNAITAYFVANPAPVPVNCAVSAWSAWSDPAWTTCTSGQQSRTLTRSRTITAQPANGGTACPALTESTTETRPCGLSATLSWTPPTRNTDGTSLGNLAGYRISYGTTEQALTQTIQVANVGLSNYVISNLTPGTYYFAVRAYTSGGTESVNSNVVSKVVQ